VNNPGLLSFLDGDDVLDYINRAGGLTDSSNYAMLIKPSGETERVNFGFLRANPSVPEGSTITVTKVPPPPPEGKGFDLSGTIKDTFAIVSSAATLAFLIYQVTK
jgi:protein involved in polysaccharide export with SLBB domain